MSAFHWVVACAGALLLLGCRPEPEGSGSAEPAADEPTATALLPGLSIYQLEGDWTDAAGREFRLESLRGHPVLVLLFYGTCTRACPSLVRDLQELEQALTPALRERTRFVLVTLDPERDTPERLGAYARERELDSRRWALLHGSPEQVRELAVALGVHYRPTPDGGFAHTLRLTLLDAEGVVATRLDGSGQPLETLGRAIAELAEAAAG